MWSLEVSAGPALEPHTVDEAKLYIRIDGTTENTYVTEMKLGARQALEEELSLALLTQTLKLRLRGWPTSARIYLPRPPLQSVSSIVYIDTTGTPQTLAASEYTVVNARSAPDVHAHKQVGYIEPAWGKSWPSLRDVPDNVTITYVAGFTAANLIPQNIRNALLVMYAELYKYRETTVTGTIVAKLDTVMRLTDSDRCRHDFGEDCG